MPSIDGPLFLLRQEQFGGQASVDAQPLQSVVESVGGRTDDVGAVAGYAS